ncbi:MAG TPA: DMT family transporter [Acidimicrobiia bacterium]|nr:DMT family transporter [Acidimicrobiia bacterium]
MTAPFTTDSPPVPIAVPRRRGGARRSVGLAACLCSAVGFGALPVLGKEAYEAGLGPLSLLWGRFGLAAAAFWVLVILVVRPARPPAAVVVTGLLMGSFGYAVEAGLFFVALERVDASLVELLLYAYPAIVTAAALADVGGSRRRRLDGDCGGDACHPGGREAPGARVLGALTLATLGVMFVFAGSLASGVDPVGLVMGLGAAAVYAAYILVGERVVASAHPVLLAALVATGATASFTAAGLVHRGGLPMPTTGDGWAMVGVIAVVATVIPMAALFAGIERVGAPTASIVSTFEPVVTVVLAGLVLGETLSLVEATGAACVLGAVRLLARGPADARPVAPDERQVSSGMSTGG